MSFIWYELEFCCLIRDMSQTALSSWYLQLFWWLWQILRIWDQQVCPICLFTLYFLFMCTFVCLCSLTVWLCRRRFASMDGIGATNLWPRGKHSAGWCNNQTVTAAYIGSQRDTANTLSASTSSQVHVLWTMELTAESFWGHSLCLKVGKEKKGCMYLTWVLKWRWSTQKSKTQ